MKLLRVIVPAAFSLVFISWVVHSLWFGDATGYLPDSLEAKVRPKYLVKMALVRECVCRRQFACMLASLKRIVPKDTVCTFAAAPFELLRSVVPFPIP